MISALEAPCGATKKTQQNRKKDLHYSDKELRLLRVGEGQVGAEADHADSGDSALTPTEAHAVLQLALEGRGHADDHQVGGGIETDGDRASRAN